MLAFPSLMTRRGGYVPFELLVYSADPLVFLWSLILLVCLEWEWNEYVCIRLDYSVLPSGFIMWRKVFQAPEKESEKRIWENLPFRWWKHYQSRKKPRDGHYAISKKQNFMRRTSGNCIIRIYDRTLGTFTRLCSSVWCDDGGCVVGWVGEWWRRGGGGDGWWWWVVVMGGGDGWWWWVVVMGGGDGWWWWVVVVMGGDRWRWVVVRACGGCW